MLVAVLVSPRSQIRDLHPTNERLFVGTPDLVRPSFFMDQYAG